MNQLWSRGLVAVLLLGCGPGSTPSTLAEAGVDDAAVADARADVAVADATPVDAAVPSSLCEGDYAPPASVGPVGDEALLEASGVVASRRADDVLWLHNDSGDQPRLYALAADDARSLGRAQILGIEAVDFEDLAAARCPGQADPCLWVGDIGDNAARRASVAVHVVLEPDLNDRLQRAEIVRSFELTYPDGPVDAEALVVAPAGDRLWILEKASDPERTRIFEGRVPAEGTQIELWTVGTFSAPGIDVERGRQITGADLHPSGRRLAVRVYTGSYEYRFGVGQGMTDLHRIEPVRVALGPLSEEQGEAIAYDHSGRGLWTVSERRSPGQPLHHYACRED